MKLGVYIVRTFLKSVGVFFGVMFLGVILSAIIYPADETPEWFITVTGFLAIAAAVVFGIATHRRTPSHSGHKQKASAYTPEVAPRDTNKPLFSGSFYHMSGLNLPPETKCKVSYWPDRLSFSAMNHTFSLDHSKVRAVTKTTRKDIQRQYVSSAGGAIAGAALFGPLGAIIGGSAKQKTVRDYSHYLIFAYGNPGEETKYIILSLTDWGSDGKKFVAAYKQQLKGTDTQIYL